MSEKTDTCQILLLKIPRESSNSAVLKIFVYLLFDIRENIFKAWVEVREKHKHKHKHIPEPQYKFMVSFLREVSVVFEETFCC